MNSLLEALNHPAEAFKRSNKAVSWGLVTITILINSIFEPVLQHFWGVNTPEIDVLKMLKVTVYGILSYLLISLAFWAICKCFGSKATLTDHINAWGISYIPTLLCSIMVAFTEVFFFLFWNSTIWGMLLNIVFVGILIWKAILCFIYLKELAGLKGWHILGASIVMGILILALASFNGYVGLKTPVL